MGKDGTWYEIEADLADEDMTKWVARGLERLGLYLVAHAAFERFEQEEA